MAHKLSPTCKCCENNCDPKVTDGFHRTTPPYGCRESIGSGWKILDGTWNIGSTSGRPPSCWLESDGGLILNGTENDELFSSVNVRFMATNPDDILEIIAGYTDLDNYYFLRIYFDELNSLGLVAAYSRISGTDTLIASVDTSLIVPRQTNLTSSWYIACFSVIGASGSTSPTKIEAYVSTNDFREIATIRENYTAGTVGKKAGLKVLGTTAARPSDAIATEVITDTLGTALLADSVAAYVADGQADGELIANIYQFDLSKDVGVIFRYQDTDNFWVAYRRNSYAVLVKKVMGTPTSFLYLTTTPTGNFEIKVNLSGSTIKLYLDGVLKATLTDSDLSSATKIGLYSEDTSYKFYDIDFDNSGGSDYFTDLFEGTADSNLSSHTPDLDSGGSGWTSVSGVLKLA